MGIGASWRPSECGPTLDRVSTRTRLVRKSGAPRTRRAAALLAAPPGGTGWRPVPGGYTRCVRRMSGVSERERWFGDSAVARVSRALAELLTIRPPAAHDRHP